MHMSDALVSPTVFVVTGAVSTALLAIAVHKVKRRLRSDDDSPTRGGHLIPLMGVMGAFIFAAQMINFSIPGTGSSGHIVGGILLSTILGPWAALITLASVLAIQCLVFADGGFLALGCNFINMAVFSCLVAYPLIFKPLMRADASVGRIFVASLLASVVGLELGAAAVTLETELSGITALPTGRFLMFMMPIHLFIGIGEGLATAAVICVIRRYRPELLADIRGAASARPPHTRRTVAIIAATALLAAASFTWIASSDPDGLEWSIAKTADKINVENKSDGLHAKAAALNKNTALMPDYNTSLAGVVGCGVIIAAAFGLSYLFRMGHRRE